MFKVNNKDIRTTLCSSLSIVNFEHVIADWGLISIDREFGNKEVVVIPGDFDGHVGGRVED